MSACACSTDPSTIRRGHRRAVAGSAGVLVPPRGYLERLREICTRHGILLIFDEVITGFGRLGKPFGSQRFGVMPDLFTTAKGMTNGAVPMGAVFVNESVHAAFMQGAEGIELFRLTYSGIPRLRRRHRDARHLRGGGEAHARGVAGKPFEDAAHALEGAPYVIDVRHCGLMARSTRAAPGAAGSGL